MEPRTDGRRAVREGLRARRRGRVCVRRLQQQVPQDRHVRRDPRVGRALPRRGHQGEVPRLRRRDLLHDRGAQPREDDQPGHRGGTVARGEHWQLPHLAVGYENGIVFAGSDSSNFYAIRATDGFLLWTLPTSARAYTVTGLGDGTVLFGQQNGQHLRRYDVTGGGPVAVWQTTLAARNMPGFAIDHDRGRIAALTGWGTGRLHFRRLSDGANLYTYGGAFGWNYCAWAPTVANDGAAYATGDTNKNLHRFVTNSIVHVAQRSLMFPESAAAGPALSFEVTRSGLDTSSALSVLVSFVDGTAAESVHFSAANTVVNFAAGVTSQSVAFSLISTNALVNRTFTVTISSLVVTVPGVESSHISDFPWNEANIDIVADYVPPNTLVCVPPAAPVSAFVGDNVIVVHTATPGPFSAVAVYTCVPDAGSAVAAVTGVIGPPTTLTCTLAYPTGERHTGAKNVTLLENSAPVILDTSGSGGMPARVRFDQRYASAAPPTAVLGDPLALAVTGDGFASGATYRCNLTAAGPIVTITATSVVYGSTTSVTCNFAAGDTGLIGTQSATLTLEEMSPLLETVPATSSVTVTFSAPPMLNVAPPVAPVVAYVADPATIVYTATTSSFNASRAYTCAPDGASGVAVVTGVIGSPTTATCTLTYPTGERHDGVFNVTLLEDGFPVSLDTSGSGGMPAQARFDQRYAGAAPLAPSIGSPLSLAVTGDGFASGPAAYECNLTAGNANVTITATSVVYGTTSLITCNFDAADTDLIGVQGATLSIKETFPLSQVVAASSVVTVTFVAPPLAAPTGPPASASVSATSFPDLGLVKLTWTQPSLALSGNLPPTVYTVYRDGAPLGTVSAPTLSYTDTTALENTAYTYTLSFNNTLGASPVSTGTVATTPFRRPAVATVNPPAVPSAGALLVTVTGAHFGASASELLHVTIGGIVNATITSWTSSSSFVFLAPSIAVATGVPVVVYTIHGSSTPSGSIDFAPAPVVLSVDPTTGGRVEGRFVEISGTEFGSSAADIDAITLASTPCTGIVWVNSTFVTCIAGVAPTVFTGAVVVSTKAGGFSAFFLAPSYAYTGPQVSAVDPDTLGAATTGGAVITLHGTHLGLDRAGGAADLLAINITDTLTTSGFDVPCAPFARAGATEATCTLPAAGLPEGTYVIEIATGTGGQLQSSATLVVGASNGTATPSPTPSVTPSAAPVPVPVILAVFPGTFPAGQSTQITITGSNFGSGPGEVTSVTIAGQVCSPVVWISPTEVTCTVSPPGPSTGPAVMTTSPGGVGTSSATFSATPATGGSAPIIVSVTPEMHPLTGGTNITIVALMLEPLVHVTFEVAGSDGGQVSSMKRGRGVPAQATLSRLQSTSAVAVVGNVTSTYEASSQKYTAVVTVPAAPGTVETYADLTVTNPAVAKSTTTKNAIYYTDLKCAAGSEYPVGSECRPCPTGAVCPGGNRVWPEPGYWNPGEDAGYVMKCRPESRCIGGEDSPCAAGYAGDLCGECAAGFIRAPSGACNPCPAQASRLIFLIGDVIVWCLVAFTAWASQSNENLQRVVDVVIVLQSAAGFASLMNEKFPSWIVTIYDAFYIFMGNYDIFKVDCYGNTTSSFGQRFVSQLVYGVAIGVLMVIGVPLVGFLRMSMSKNTEDQDRKAFLKQYTYDRCVRCFSTWCQIIFMNWTRRALEAVYCLPFPDGTQRLASFPTVHCFKGFHTIAFAISCVILLALTIGWPLLYSLLVVRGRSTEELYGEPRVMHRWGNGYILLKPSQRYFYLNFYFTATCVSTAYVLFADNPIARLCLAGGAILVEVLAIFRAGPHANSRDDWVQLSYDIPMAMLVAVTSAAELGTLSTVTIYILSLVALALISLCFLFHVGDLVLHLIGADPDNYKLGVADRFLEDGNGSGGGIIDESKDQEDENGALGPTGLPNAVAMRHRRRSVFEDVGVALGFMDEDQVGEGDVFVDVSSGGSVVDANGSNEKSFLATVVEMLGFGDGDDEANLESPPAHQQVRHQDHQPAAEQNQQHQLPSAVTNGTLDSAAIAAQAVPVIPTTFGAPAGHGSENVQENGIQ